MTGAPPPSPTGAATGMAHTVLVVDDDPVVRVLLRDLLEADGHAVAEAIDAAEARGRLADGRWDLVLLDRRLPDADGLLLLAPIRDSSGCPVIVLSVLDDEHNRMLGLGLGATDYIAKPFSAVDMRSRVRRALGDRYRDGRFRDTPGPAEPSCGPFRLLPSRRRLHAGSAVHDLTPAETRLMAVFLGRAGVVLSRQDLTRLVCGRDWTHADRTIDVLVSRLRRRIEPLPKRPVWIVTVHGMGYVFHKPERDAAPLT